MCDERTTNQGGTHVQGAVLRIDTCVGLATSFARRQGSGEFFAVETSGTANMSV